MLIYCLKNNNNIECACIVCWQPFQSNFQCAFELDGTEERVEASKRGAQYIECEAMEVGMVNQKFLEKKQRTEIDF